MKYPEIIESIGLAAEICFIINYANRDDREILEFQSWEAIQGVNEVFYVHGEIQLSDYCFTHLDGAHIALSGNQIYEIFYGNTRPKGPKKKLFKIGGRVNYEDSLSIIKAFLPVEELNEEVFNICRLPK